MQSCFHIVQVQADLCDLCSSRTCLTPPVNGFTVTVKSAVVLVLHARPSAALCFEAD